MAFRSSCMKRSVRLVLAMILIGSVAGPPPAEAGTIITLDSGFNQPFGVAVDGNVIRTTEEDAA